MQWLDIWLDSQPSFTIYVNEQIKNAKVAKINIKELNQI